MTVDRIELGTAIALIIGALLTAYGVWCQRQAWHQIGQHQAALLDDQTRLSAEAEAWHGVIRATYALQRALMTAGAEAAVWSGPVQDAMLELDVALMLLDMAACDTPASDDVRPGPGLGRLTSR